MRRLMTYINTFRHVIPTVTTLGGKGIDDVSKGVIQTER